MKRILSLVALATLVTLTVGARSWRVNNNAARAPHFADINAAVASADVQDGDTLYLDPDCSLSATQTVTKTLTIIGPGYFLSGLPYTAATLSGTLILKAQNCKVEGLELAAVSIQADNVTIERCKATGISWKSGVSGKNAIIRQCYVLGRISGLGETNANSASCTIENCKVANSATDNWGCIASLYNATIRNNYLNRTANISSSYSNSERDAAIYYCQGSNITNNVIFNTKYKDRVFYGTDNTTIKNNVCSSAENASYAENVYLSSTDLTAVFTCAGGNDLQFQLRDDSPAKGYATDGGDCGPYGGLFPYVPSGHPAGMPYYVTTNTPTHSTNGQVKITQHVKLQTR